MGALSRLCRLLNDAQVLSSGFAGPTICNQVKRDLLAFIEGAQACLLHGGDVDKNIITAAMLYATYAPSIANLISVDQEPSMTNPKFDREAMGRLAKALAFICGPDHPTTMALKAAAVNGSDQEIKNARALFLRLSPGDRQAASANGSIWRTRELENIIGT